MGLIKAALGAAGGVLADQWKEYFYCESLPADVLAVKGRKRVSGSSSNTSGSDNIISNGSVIAVVDGQCMIIVEQGKVVDVCAEPGEYTYDMSTEPSIFSGDLGTSIKSVFMNIGKRFTFGGEAPKDQRVYYFNTKELMGNKYGTQNPVPFRVVDNNIGLDMDVSIRCFGEYSYRITNPILFYTNVCGNVERSYTRDKLDSQLKSELLTALQPAFARVSEMGIRYSALPGHTMEIADALNDVLSAKWANLRGVEIVSFGVSSVRASDEDEAMIKELQRNATFRDPTMAAAHMVGAQAAAMQAAAASENTTTDSSATSTEKTEAVDEDKSETSSVMVYYGWGSGSDEEKYTSEIFCPKGAVFSEKTLQINEEDGSVMTVEVDDEVNEYSATSSMHWHRDAYNSEPTAYPIIAQLYFDGELDAETAAENNGCSQEVTPLGFKWNGYDVILIETKYTFKDYGETTELFAGVEYDLDYWKAEEGTGEIQDLTTKALFGFDLYSYSLDELTQEKCAWIIGELFGVDSGVANPFAVNAEETTAAVVNVDAGKLLGTWLERDSDWDNTYIFNADGTGVLISGPEYPFTFTTSGDVLTLIYDDEDTEEFTISVSGELLTMVDQFGNEILLDKQVSQSEEAEKPEEAEVTVETDSGNPYVKEILGTWVDEESGYQETFTFKADGTGMYSYVDGGLYEFPITYDFLRSDYLEFFYEDGSEGGFIIRIEGDTMYVTNESVVDMPLVRQ